ncbi:RimJ/RimL family protein N-acetyltransferase [Pelomonas saccharophila]|uniref:RimJ/RimL family protein N-acetyltransferase n=1 Tax=Roseateles saccharophilus TaxID=304 RepID=A0ABU1YV08_ROSSA|nr:GNAT family N-acetyltransferase [Roseateles saccharophilus]MDR7272712.1 RimJ/RimL family protein N-acetyltransferase [Roseateles saccharophilus]
MVTRRLMLRPPRGSDLDTLTALHADPAVNRFCAAATPHGREAIQAQLQAWINHWQTRGFGHWAIAERDQPDTLIGFGGLMHRSVAGHSGLYLYYRITPQAWGRGLASEMAQYAMSQAFEQHHEGAVVAAVLPSNAPTRKTLECLGLRLKGTLADGPGSAAALLYELSADRWATLPRGEPEAIAFAA